MFYGLYDIDWESFGKYHIGTAQNPKDIPRHIELLLSENKDKRYYATEWLLGSGQHTGMIVKGTPHLIPFVLEVLALDDYPDKAEILCDLRWVAYHMFPTQSVSNMRLSIATYDALASGFDLYVDLLKHDDPNIRFYIVRLFRYLQEHVSQTLPLLKDLLESESNLRMRVTIIRSMIEPLGDMFEINYLMHKPYVKLIFDNIINAEEIIERYVSADVLEKANYGFYGERQKLLDAVKQEYEQIKDSLPIDTVNPINLAPFPWV